MSMSYNNLGNTDIKVSEICLGSMTWGTQNTEAEGHAQIDLALDHGVNFIDTAEMYPVWLAKLAGRCDRRLLCRACHKPARRTYGISRPHRCYMSL